MVLVNIQQHDVNREIWDQPMLFKSLISQKLITLITMHRYIPSSALPGVLNVPTICLEWYLTIIVFLPPTVLLTHQTEEIVFEKGAGSKEGRSLTERARALENFGTADVII